MVDRALGLDFQLLFVVLHFAKNLLQVKKIVGYLPDVLLLHCAEVELRMVQAPQLERLVASLREEELRLSLDLLR